MHAAITDGIRPRLIHFRRRHSNPPHCDQGPLPTTVPSVSSLQASCCSWSTAMPTNSGCGERACADLRHMRQCSHHEHRRMCCQRRCHRCRGLSLLLLLVWRRRLNIWGWSVRVAVCITCVDSPPQAPTDVLPTTVPVGVAGTGLFAAPGRRRRRLDIWGWSGCVCRSSQASVKPPHGLVVRCRRWYCICISKTDFLSLLICRNPIGTSPVGACACSVWSHRLSKPPRSRLSRRACTIDVAGADILNLLVDRNAVLIAAVFVYGYRSRRICCRNHRIPTVA